MIIMIMMAVKDNDDDRDYVDGDDGGVDHDGDDGGDDASARDQRWC